MGKEVIVKGFKGFDRNMKCRGFQYKVGKTYETDKTIYPCRWGFHFCEALEQCFNFYTYDDIYRPGNRFAEVEAHGRIIRDTGKIVTDKIKIVRELSSEEIRAALNTGKGNTGVYNVGNDNEGRKNTGNSNNGHLNIGDNNKGNYNTGLDNKGNENIGRLNEGNGNTGRSNYGNTNIGENNRGKNNNGRKNTGNNNTGLNNIGDRNTGDYNTGNDNIGKYNCGDRNIGNLNYGKDNIGYANKGESCHGIFCTKPSKVFSIFNKPSEMNITEVMTLPACRVLLTTCGTAAARNVHPGLTADKQYKALWTDMWKRQSQRIKEQIFNLPGFNLETFTEITGIKPYRAYATYMRNK
jgi:hypothetical protein